MKNTKDITIKVNSNVTTLLGIEVQSSTLVKSYIDSKELYLMVLGQGIIGENNVSFVHQYKVELKSKQAFVYELVRGSFVLQGKVDIHNLNAFAIIKLSEEIAEFADRIDFLGYKQSSDEEYFRIEKGASFYFDCHSHGFTVYTGYGQRVTNDVKSVEA